MGRRERARRRARSRRPRVPPTAGNPPASVARRQKRASRQRERGRRDGWAHRISGAAGEGTSSRGRRGSGMTRRSWVLVALSVVLALASLLGVDGADPERTLAAPVAGPLAAPDNSITLQPFLSG